MTAHSSAGSIAQLSREESTSILMKKIESLRAMEVQNRELKLQVTQTKRILTRLEEQ